MARRKNRKVAKPKRATAAQIRKTGIIDVQIDPGPTYSGRRPKSTKKIGGTRMAVPHTSSRRNKSAGKRA